jgi:NAD(P)H-dependent FMN reductase
MVTCQHFSEGIYVTKLNIGIIIGSTRPGRLGEQVARWVLSEAQARGDANYELIDLLDYNLPHLDEAVPASMGAYANAHTLAWAAKIDSLDGFVFVTPEYNHSTSGALKNAIDFVYAEWNNKAAAFVSYGSAGGTRAVEHLRLIVGELQIADVRAQVALSLHTDFESYSTLTAGPQHAPALATALDQLTSWSGALRTVREDALAQAA